ncbi:MAG TPA: hypothetical protein VGR74_11965 [Actinomycetota bacterium]|nr:hypothetical protein [Actinomycetota bacterium]
MVVGRLVAVVGDVVALIGDAVAVVGGPLPRVGGLLTVVGGLLTVVGGPLPRVGGLLAVVGGVVAFVGGPLALVGGVVALVSGPLPFVKIVLRSVQRRGAAGQPGLGRLQCRLCLLGACLGLPDSGVVDGRLAMRSRWACWTISWASSATRRRDDRARARTC